MKQKGLLFLTLFCLFSMLTPVYANETGTINHISKLAYANIGPINVDGTNYEFILTLIVHRRHTGTMPVEKHEVGVLVINNSQSITSELSTHDYTIPNFSNGNIPSLNTTFLLNNTELDDDLAISVDLKWECVEKKTTFTDHNPPTNIEIPPFESYTGIYCPAIVSGSIEITNQEATLVNIPNARYDGRISCFRYVIDNSD